MYAGELIRLGPVHEILADPVAAQRMRDGIGSGDLYVVESAIPVDLIDSIRDYLATIGSSSLPNYQAIVEGCPNFHRIDRWDERSHVGACVHSFSFFPWNHDVFGFFDLFAPIYHLKNLVSGVEPDSFLGREPDRGCTARISFQYYPKGIGGLNRHQDPVGYHQLTVPSLIMSRKGRDFTEGGLYVEKAENERLYVDDHCDVGDVVFFNAEHNHGVERIDPDADPDWLSQEGRWMALFAVNKLTGNEAIGDSTDLEDSEAQP